MKLYIFCETGYTQFLKVPVDTNNVIESNGFGNKIINGIQYVPPVGLVMSMPNYTSSIYCMSYEKLSTQGTDI
jgi:hypothetical protein